MLEILGYEVSVTLLWVIGSCLTYLLGYPIASAIIKGDQRKVVLWPYTMVMFLLYSFIWVTLNMLKGWKE